MTSIWICFSIWIFSECRGHFFLHSLINLWKITLVAVFGKRSLWIDWLHSLRFCMTTRFFSIIVKYEFWLLFFSCLALQYPLLKSASIRSIMRHIWIKSFRYLLDSHRNEFWDHLVWTILIFKWFFTHLFFRSFLVACNYLFLSIVADIKSIFRNGVVKILASILQRRVIEFWFKNINSFWKFGFRICLFELVKNCDNNLLMVFMSKHD